MKFKKIIYILFMAPFTVSASGLILENSSDFKKNMPQGTEEYLEKYDVRDEQIKRNGYAVEDSAYSRRLLDMKAGKNLDFTKENDTHLKKDVKDIQLAFKFNSYPNAIAYAPVGTYTSSGWTGVKVFFDTKNMGFCSYFYMNLEASNITAKIDNTDNKNYINNKPTFNEVIGSPSSGFLYTTRWYDKNSVNMLECVNKTYDASIIEKLVGHAKIIDKTMRS